MRGVKTWFSFFLVLAYKPLNTCYNWWTGICRDLTDCRTGPAFFGHCNIFSHRCKPFLSIPISFGEVAEWSKAVDSKSIVRLRVPGVRIPPSPPSIVTLWSSSLKWICSTGERVPPFHTLCLAFDDFPVGNIDGLSCMNVETRRKRGDTTGIWGFISWEISPVSESKIEGSPQFRSIH